MSTNSTRKTRKFLIKMSEDEFLHLSNLSGAYNISRAEVVRRLCLNQGMPINRLKYKFITKSLKNAIKINGDLAKLGNLFKLAINIYEKDKTGTIFTRY